MLLRIKDIREVLEKTLSMFYAFPDFSINPTKVMDRDKEFRIEFRIYDAEFWMDVDPMIDSIQIGTRSFGEPDHLDTIRIWLQKPYHYSTERFEFGWRSDLESFFDGFLAYLEERVEKMHNPPADKADEPKKEKSELSQCVDAAYSKRSERKTSIFNSLKDDEEDEYI